MQKKKFLIVLLFAWIRIWGEESLWAQPFIDNNFKAPSTLQIVEGVNLCYGGMGSQQTTLRLSSKDVTDKNSDNAYLPEVQLESNLFLQFGCKYDRLIFDYTLADDSFRFSESVDVDGESYNSVQLHQETITVGYAFTIVPHYLYFDTGLGYYQLIYTLGFFEGNSSTDKTAIEKRNSGYLWYGSAKYFMTSFLFFQWRYQQTFDQDNLVSSNSQLGINFYIRL